MFKRESAIIRYEGQIISTSVGSYGAVDFDFEAVWAFKKSISNFDLNKLDFIHVHPPEFTQFSYQDQLCAKSLKLAFGAPVIMGLVVFTRPTIITKFICDGFFMLKWGSHIPLSQLKLLYRLSSGE